LHVLADKRFCVVEAHAEMDSIPLEHKRPAVLETLSLCLRLFACGCVISAFAGQDPSSQ
jgi:hypothetical protein